MQVVSGSPTAWSPGYRAGLDGPGVWTSDTCTSEASSLNKCAYKNGDYDTWALTGYEACALGQEQTPINIDTASTLSHKHTDLFLHYTAHTGLSFLNNGATLIVPMPITHQYVNKRPGIMAEFEGIP